MAKQAMLTVIESNPGITFADAYRRAGVNVQAAFDALAELLGQGRVRRVNTTGLYV
jgi:hypothetical protein